MLTGTSRAPDEIVNDNYLPESRIVTVEKVAINAVMAGCTPEMMPVALAMAELNGCSTQHETNMGWYYVVSGPIAEEIGMNSGVELMSSGNPANTTLARFCRLAGQNLGGGEIGSTNTRSQGSSILGLVMAESEDSPWEGMNEDLGYDADESVLIPFGLKVALVSVETLPHEYGRSSIEQVLANFTMHEVGHATGRTIIITPNNARKWKENYGFDTLQEVQDYLWENFTWTAGEWYNNYWFYMAEPNIRTANEYGVRHWCMDHLDLPDDALVPLAPSPEDFKVLVAGGGPGAPGICVGMGNVGCGPFSFPTVEDIGLVSCPVTIDKWR